MKTPDCNSDATAALPPAQGSAAIGDDMSDEAEYINNLQPGWREENALKNRWHARGSEVPLAVCSKCHRHTFDSAHVMSAWWRCGVTQPDGSKCLGVWVPLDAVDPQSEAATRAIGTPYPTETWAQAALRLEGALVDERVTTGALRRQIQALVEQQAELLAPRHAAHVNRIAVLNLLDKADSGMPITSEDIRRLLPPNSDMSEGASQ